MTAESDADRLSFFDADDFGITATIGGSSVAGIFDDEYAPVEIGESLVESSAPAFHCRTTDLPSITLNTTTATIDGTAYVIVEQLDDGTGLTILRLRDPS